MKSFFKKNSWVLLLVSLFIFDAIWITNSDFSNKKSTVIKIKNSDSSIVNLFENSYYKIIKPINIEEDGAFLFENSQHYFALIKINTRGENQSSITYKISNKLHVSNIKFNENQNINEIKTISNNWLFWILNENRHNLYKVNIFILLFVFIYFLKGDNI